MTPRIALVGSRGHVGQAFAQLLQDADDLTLSVVTSRDAAPGAPTNNSPLALGAMHLPSDPEIVAASECDVYVLAMPNDAAPAFVHAIDRHCPQAMIVDLGAYYRHHDGWSFGMSDLYADALIGARRIANPGCFATAAILGLYPLRTFMNGSPVVFGLSGYSGAGTTPSPRNDVQRLANSALPYAFAGHAHQQEISTTIGRRVRFLPHVGGFFRGLLATISVPVIAGTRIDDVRDAVHQAYAGNPTITISGEPAEIRDVVQTPNAIIGGFAIDLATQHLALTVVHDNLLKGAASQALANIRLSLGLPRRDV